ncbi:SDR family NAD(P)-dependent oxidoreductase [Nioella sediminis]|uniref:SDR family NAD(P)-dependent oxidoreductase n=1 Tax=Nioella sediminis TaxID=1912092 RepID=UPI000B212444|nr:SDR family oxidoreductase [Nioella sediminis]
MALVTGGRTGIGRAIAERLRDEGAQVFTAQRGASEGFATIEVDFTDPDSPCQVVETLISHAGQLDVLINNAGVMQEAGIEETSLADWQRCLSINLTAPFLMIRAALPHLRATRGCIVNVGSIEGIAANPNHTAYCASKAGLHGLTRAVAVDHGAEGIRCNAVAPGWIETDLNRDLVAARPDHTEFADRIAAIHPLARTGQPREVAALVAYLASGDAGFVTGQVYPIEGGRLAKLSLPTG